MIIPNAASVTLYPVIEGKVIPPDSIVYTNSWCGYNVLDVSGFKHDRINHSQLFAQGRHHINGIENFWNQAKRHMRKFNGVPRDNFVLFLKDCEWRFNTSDPKRQLSQIKQWVRDNTNSLSGTAPKILLQYLRKMPINQARPLIPFSHILYNGSSLAGP